MKIEGHTDQEIKENILEDGDHVVTAYMEEPPAEYIKDNFGWILNQMKKVDKTKLPEIGLFGFKDKKFIPIMKDEKRKFRDFKYVYTQKH